MPEEIRCDKGFGTYEDLGNGYTKDGSMAEDYKSAGRDPNLPRVSSQEIEAAIQKLLPKSNQ